MVESADPCSLTRDKQHHTKEICSLVSGNKLCEGMVCPRCQAAQLTYDGLLNLTCPHCGLTETGAFT